MSTNQQIGPGPSSITIAWDDSGTPIAEQFGDPYYSRHDGRAETRHVFLDLNGLPGRWQHADHFTIGELGFGTGLNFFETLAAWRKAETPPGARLSYVSFERFPLSAADLERAISAWPDLMPDCVGLLAHWPPSADRLEAQFGDVSLDLRIGDANVAVAAWRGKADAWFLDGFSPAKNPDMWGAELMRTVCNHTNAGGTFATFTAAGWVRRNLLDAGFTVGKAAGYGRKRECLQGAKTVAPT